MDANPRDRMAGHSDPTCLQMVRAVETDIPFVMAAERLPGYEDLVGRWDEAGHQAALYDDRYAYFVARDDAEPIGFAVVRDWGSPEQVALLKRIVMTRPGCGYGKAFLSALVDAVFRQTNAYRVWLGVFPENARARRAYEAVGFREEGIARGSALINGAHRDEVIMSILRPEWAVRSTHSPTES